MEKHLLVVDDDPAIRGLTSDFLRDAGYSVDVAANGREALEAVRSHRPDAVLLDMMMPEMDGPSFVQVCRSRGLCDGIPIVAISAMPEAPRVAERLGLHACFGKPFDLEALSATLDRLTS